MLVLLLATMLGACLPAGAQSADSGSPEAASDTATDSKSGENADIQALIKALRNDKTRGKVLDALEKSTAADATQSNTVVEPEKNESTESFGRRIAGFTQGIAESAAGSASRFASQISAVPDRFSALGPNEIDILLEALWDVALAIVTTYVIFLIFRRIALLLFQRIGRVAADSGFMRTIVLIVASALIDAAVVVLAWAVGYLITLTLFGDFGTVGIRQSLYLNAFLVVEMFKVVLRIVLSPATGDLRLVNITDHAARVLNSRLTWIASILGYGQLFITPIFNQSVSFPAGQAVSILLALIALVIAVSMTVRNRHSVKAWLVEETTEKRSPSRFVRFIAHNWYWVALLYFAFLFVVVVARPADELLPVLGATGKLVLALIVGLGITGWIARSNARGVHLPESVTQKLPMLEMRLNRSVPRILTVARVLVFVAIAVIALDVLNLIDVRAWMTTDVGAATSKAMASVIFILLAAFAIWLAMTSWVDFRLNPDFGSVPSSREQTLLTLLRNAAMIALLAITLMFVLSEIGLDIAPLLASAGVLGLAIGFGAQKLVQDIITGVFIQLENAINVGDVVTVGGITGTAERLTIRSVSLRDLDGTFHIIPFSSVDQVSNFMKEFSYSVCNMGVAYREDIDEVREAMSEAFEMLRGDEANAAKIIGDMEWFGVTTFADSSVVVRTRIKTLAGSQWGIGRAYNGCLKKVFDARGIEIPFPHQTLYFGEDKDHTAPPARVLLRDEKNAARIEPQQEEAAAPAHSTVLPDDPPKDPDEDES